MEGFVAIRVEALDFHRFSAWFTYMLRIHLHDYTLSSDLRGRGFPHVITMFVQIGRRRPRNYFGA